MSQQPKDNANEPIPVLGFRPNGGHIVPFTTDSSSTSPLISTSVRVITLYSTQDVFIETGTPAMLLVLLVSAAVNCV